MAREMAREVPQLDAEISSGTLKLSEVRGNSYDAVVVVGGHGAMFDIDRNAEVHRILRQANDAGKIVAAECHGTGALAFASSFPASANEGNFIRIVLFGIIGMRMRLPGFIF